MGKRHKRAPKAGPKVWITMALIVAGVILIIIVNGEFAKQTGFRQACLEAQKPVVDAVEKLRKSHPGEVEKTLPKDMAALLARLGGLAKLPDHPGTEPGKPSPYTFGANGAFYCAEHGQADPRKLGGK